MTTIDAMHVAYLTVAVLLVLSIKSLARRASSTRGIWLGVAGVVLAILATLIHPAILSDANETQSLGYGLILLAVALGSGLGAALAFRTETAALADVSGLFAGLGGGAAAFTSGAFVHSLAASDPPTESWQLPAITLALSAWLGAASLGGCTMAFVRLQGFALVKPLVVPVRGAICTALSAVALGLGVWLTASPSSVLAFWAIFLIAVAWGVLAMGTTDMSDLPVGIMACGALAAPAAAAAGLVAANQPLAIGGALIGAAGFVKLQTACRTKERTFLGLLLGSVPVDNSPK